MTWEWQVWRCFDNIRDAFEERGWEYRFADDGVAPVMAESDSYCISFCKRNPTTGECWFELRDMTRSKMVFLQGTENIPTPAKAAQLLASYGGPLYEVIDLDERSMYGLPVVPVVNAA